tara:strand:- start:56 stop:262 length:207 start_codon:yes stop_codon:yes gene_type:complete
MTTLEKEFPHIHRNLMMKDDAEKLIRKFMHIHRELSSMINVNDKSKLVLNAYINEMKSLFNDGRNLGF